MSLGALFRQWPQLFLALMFWTSNALAQYGIQTVRATPVFVFEDEVPAGIPIAYHTQILTSGGDTVLHVLENTPPFRQIAASDDCQDKAEHRGMRGPRYGDDADDDDEDKDEGAAVRRGLSSCITVKLATATRVRVLVRASRNTSGGFANLLRNGVAVATNFPFAGTQVPVKWAANDVFETPLASPTRFPGASTDTQLLLIQDPPLGVVAYDDDSGAGLASKLVAPGSSNAFPLSSAHASVIVVASTSATTEGPARLVTNDVLHKDIDGDGLGDLLEASQDPGGDLPTLPGKADSDGDGLSDGVELLGVDGTHPQLLSRWGANPRHRDLFIEVDRDKSGPSSGVTLSAADAHALAARLALWPNAELNNLDGRDGVALHVDNGTAGAGDVSGDLGGSNDVSTAGALQQVASANMNPERSGLFVYALAKFGCEEEAHLGGRRVVFASTCGGFAWMNLAYNLSQNLKWGDSCCAFRHF